MASPLRLPLHRQATRRVRIFDAQRRPLPAGVPVHVTQVRADFLVGANAFALRPESTEATQRELQQRFVELFNFATLPFYWGRYEPAAGQTRRAELTALARWCLANGIRTKGHPLCWHEVWPGWCQDEAGVEALQWERIRREIRDFAGLVTMWDVLNEAVVMPTFTRTSSPLIAHCRVVGQVALIRRAFAAAQDAGVSGLTLLLNDYEVSSAYEELIARCLDAGVPIGAIGIQSHMHAGYWGAEKAADVCTRFARFGRPLHFTELTVLSGPRKENQRWGGERYTDWHSTPECEAQQAAQVEELYRLLFSVPSVEAVTWWDAWDGATWLGAPAGLLRHDLSPKPAYEVLRRLARDEWWTPPQTLATDREGAVTLSGAKGEYRIEALGQAAAFRLSDEARCVELPLAVL